MNLSTIVRFQFGQASAIETVARNGGSLYTGLALVLLTAIARNYDQTFILETPLWLLGPLLFSLFSGSFLFLILYHACIRPYLETPNTVSSLAQWCSFMSLFWMSAPTAWLYALPVERFLSSYRSAQANLALLACVSLWRVLLMARVVSVLQGLPLARALACVLVPACLEFILVVYVGGFFSAAFGRNMLAAMSGLRNAPEKDLIFSVLVGASTGAFAILALALLVLTSRRFRDRVRPFPLPTTGSFPVYALLLLAGIWIAVALPAQLEQRRFVMHAQLIKDGKFRESVDFLARHDRRQFPASRRLEPNPYEYGVFEQLPKVMATLQATDPEWIRTLYLSHLTALFSHRWVNMEPDQLLDVFSAVERLLEGKNWTEQNRSGLRKISLTMNGGRNSGGDETRSREQLTNVLARLGIDLETWEDKRFSE